MAVKIRMKKLGRKHRPFFRVCAIDSRAPRDGRVIEELGHYDPMCSETDARAILKADRIDYWIGVGAQPSPKVDVLIKKYGTNGSHLSQQQAALERLASRRGQAIDAARKAAADAAAAAPAPAETPETPSADAAPPADAEATTEATEEATSDATETTAENTASDGDAGESEDKS